MITFLLLFVLGNAWAIYLLFKGDSNRDKEENSIFGRFIYWILE